MEKLQALQAAKGYSASELPADFSSYQKFLKLVGKSLDNAATPEEKAKIIRTLIHKLEIGTDSVKIHYYAGKERLREAFASRGSFHHVGGSSTLVPYYYP